MNIFGFRPFKGRFNLGNSDDIPTNQDGTLIGAVKRINNDLNDKADKTELGAKVQQLTISGTSEAFVLPSGARGGIFILGAGASKAIFLVQIIGGISQICDFISPAYVTYSLNVSTRTVTITHSNTGNVGSLWGVYIPV